MLPAAPPRFSTTTVRPSRSLNPLPTKRASVSATPPGANATIKVMSRAGYDCALAARAPSTPPSAAKAMTTFMRKRLFGISIPPSRPIVLFAGAGADARIVPPCPRLDKVAMSQQRPRRRVRSFRRLLQFRLSLRTRPRAHKTRCALRLLYVHYPSKTDIRQRDWQVRFVPEAGIPTNLSGIREHPILGDDGITFDAMGTGQQDLVPDEGRREQPLDLPTVKSLPKKTKINTTTRTRPSPPPP